MAACESFSLRSGEHVRMEIDQARSDIQAGDIDHFPRLRCGNVPLNGGDPAISDGDITYGVDLVFWIDNMSSLEEQVIGSLSEQTVRAEDESQEAHGEPTILSGSGLL